MLSEIRLKQFRSYKEQKFTFSPGVNIVIGPNASGKTNLLESVIVVYQGGSYRAPDLELIKHNYEWSRIDALDTNKKTRTVKLTANNKINKEIIIGNKSYQRLSLNNQLPVVLFEPNHLLFLSGSPELRRNYLDEILKQIKPGYKKTLNDYVKTLRQRNALLKSEGAKSNLFPWNVRLSHLGGLIAIARSELIERLNQQVKSIYQAISQDKAIVSLRYQPLVNIDQYESLMMQRLETNQEVDLLRGFTTTGPHREDMEVLVNLKPVIAIASRGENRTIVIALKILEAEIITTEKAKPIILLDDVFSELDATRRQLLVSFIAPYQTLITATEFNNFTKTVTKNTSIINITNNN
jgi:DNA replication and repair protein RecF